MEPSSMNDLIRKFQSREAVVSVIGLGYVGLALAVEFLEAGFRVYGVDVDPGKVEILKRGESYIEDVPSEKIQKHLGSGAFVPDTDFKILNRADAISICVPTPLRKTKDPDISFIVSALQQIRKHFRKGQLIVLESTTYPGTTEEVVLPVLAESGLVVGKDFYLAFSPERVDPGNKRFTTKNTPKIIAGITPECTEVGAAFYGQIIDRVIPVSSTRTAEMVKLLENTFRAVNIALVNETALICDRLGVDVWEVIEAAATKPFGFMPFYPGPGLGGHCIPIDPHYLSWKLKTLNYNARFIALADEVNTYMPVYVVMKIADALNEKKKSLSESKILILGVSYKKNSRDIRESPALEIIRQLLSRRASVRYHDPLVESLPEFPELPRVPLTEEVVRSADCVVIVTDHDGVDYPFVVDRADLVVDTRNATGSIRSDNVVKL
jgi:UDP-N-acetyl-D-glucosamine dehydrogenase